MYEADLSKRNYLSLPLLSILQQIVLHTESLFIQLQQPPNLNTATTPSSSLQNLLTFAHRSSRCSVHRIERIREESHTDNQQFLDSIDEGMKKVIKEQVKKECPPPPLPKDPTPKIEKFSKTNNSDRVLIEANNSINRSNIQRQLYKALVDAYEADKILLDTYGDTFKANAYNTKRRSGKEPESTNASREKTTTTAGKTTTGSKTHKQYASQPAPAEETMQSTDVFDAPTHQEVETGVHDEQAEKEVHHLPD
ncbi:hypothetical protein Tco_1341919 [Tanacetum coccineum]